MRTLVPVPLNHSITLRFDGAANTIIPTMRHLYFTAFLALLTPHLASAQQVVHYWNFTTMDDVVGGVSTSGVGTIDMSLDATYGEAYPGSGQTLNTTIGGITNGSGYLEADVFGPTVAFDFGTDSFSFSYWVWDDFASDGDMRGPRIFDCLSVTTTGIQLGTTMANEWNFRVDDSQGAVTIFNNVTPFVLPQNRWYHVTGVVDRAGSEVRAYVDGALAAAIPFNNQTGGAPVTGNVFPTQDLQIGAINEGQNVNGAQTQGLDDLAFYEGVLSAADAAALAAGTATPLSFMGGVGTNYCTANANSTGIAGGISALGSESVAANDVTLVASNIPVGQFGIFVVADATDIVAVNSGVLCLGGQIGRYQQPGQILQADAAGQFSLSIDITMLPTPTAFVSAAPGDTFYFQAWHRDFDMAGANTSNFTNGLQVDFQ